MTMRFEQILADGIAQCSYLLGDDGAGVAAVVDPRPDVDNYLDIARRYGLAHVFETHIHADFMSGAREPVERLGGNTRLCVRRGLGRVRLLPPRHPRRRCRRLRRPAPRRAARSGHTPEHLAFLLFEGDSDDPWGVLTGDSFFVDSVGRPDLLGDDETEALTERSCTPRASSTWGCPTM